MTEIIHEKWMRGVAITTTVLAVMTAIVSARSNNCTADTQLATSQEAMKWQYYQSKSIKVQLIDVQKSILENRLLDISTPEQKKAIEDKLAAYDASAAKYNKQKAEIEAEAKNLGKKKTIIGKQGYQFTIAVVFFQIAIMLSSVSALLQKKTLWIVGLVFGCIAIVFFVNGFFLFF